MKKLCYVCFITVFIISMIMPVYSVTTDTPEIVFSDVQPGQWFYDDVITLANKGVITGVTTPVNGVGRYNPQGIVTLGEFLAISTRLVAKQYVMEIPGEKNWAGPYYSTAVDFLIINREDFSDRPEALYAPISREDMALILVNIAKLNGERLEEKPIVTRAIKDYDSISSSRTDAVKKAYANGLIIGDENGNFNPNKSLTRAEVATVFCRVMKYTRRPVAEGAPKKLIVWSYTDEFHRILRKYQEFHPDQNIEFGGGIIGTPFYQEFLDKEFASSGPETPDIYTVDSSFALKYTKGDASQYAATYKELGIEVDRLLKEAEIAQYTVDIGTRPSDREIVALSYQGTAGACIYRRSIAKDVWGTDDPQIIKNKIGPDWEKFFKAAEELKAKDYGIVSSDRDIWNVIEGSSPTGWIVNGKLNIDPSREKFIDYAKQIKDNGWSNNTDTWSSPWYDDMMDDNEQKVFCYFGPAWFINYCLVPSSFSEYKPNIEGTYGDWAVCEPPANFFWSGSWVLASKNNIDKDAVGDILKWITLDSSNTGLQYLKANGFTIDRETEAKDAVPSATVMRKSNGKLDFLDGQDMFDVFIPANASVSGENKTEYDEVINTYWLSVIREYMDGEITRSQVIPRFEIMVSDNQIIVD